MRQDASKLALSFLVSSEMGVREHPVHQEGKEDKGATVPRPETADPRRILKLMNLSVVRQTGM